MWKQILVKVARRLKTGTSEQLEHREVETRSDQSHPTQTGIPQSRYVHVQQLHDLGNLPRPAVYHQTIRPRSRPLEILDVVLPLVQEPGDNVVAEWESERGVWVSEELRVEHPHCLIRIATVCVRFDPGSALGRRCGWVCVCWVRR